MSKSVVTRKYEQVKKEIYNMILKDIGYKRHGSQFEYVEDGVGFYIGFQRSRWTNPDTCKFTINYGMNSMVEDYGFECPIQRVRNIRGDEIWFEINKFTEPEILIQQVSDIIHHNILVNFKSESENYKININQIISYKEGL